ncbi:hypothetical protein NDU88_001423 [Pleurodeles waltl]|uniref:Uncharacterized protein n=1 Tax=Pleurodeles waltl TaxID=8319 RepID=A0AAV7Q606_PLEWA|nr:hypothetical protein NDU88_001423 [Pleurodeles waltl]
MGVHLGQGLRHSSSSPLPRSSARAPRAGTGAVSALPSPGAQSADGLPMGAKAQQGTRAWISGPAARARRHVVLPSRVSDGAAFQCATLCAAYVLGPRHLLPVSRSSGSRCPVRRDTDPQSTPGLFGPGAMLFRPAVFSRGCPPDPLSATAEGAAPPGAVPVVLDGSRQSGSACCLVARPPGHGAVSSRARSGLWAGAAPRRPQAPPSSGFRAPGVRWHQGTPRVPVGTTAGSYAVVDSGG